MEGQIRQGLVNHDSSSGLNYGKIGSLGCEQKGDTSTLKLLKGHSAWCTENRQHG